MDPQAGASFIPKRSLDTSSPHSAGGLLFFVSLLIFIASIVAAGSVFLYQQYLQGAIANKSQSLSLAQGAFDPSTIQDLLRLDSRINQAEIRLANHVAASAMFAFLSTQTLQNVSFTSFDYEVQPDGSATLKLAGQADSFSTVALQSDQFGSSKLLKNVVFSNIVVATNGSITFSVNADIDPSLVSYATALQNGAASATTVPTSIATTSPATSTPQ